MPPLPKPQRQSPRDERDTESLGPGVAEKRVDPLFAIKTIDPSDPEGLEEPLAALRRLHPQNAPEATVTAILDVIAKTLEIPRTAHFRASVMTTLWNVAPKNNDEVAKLLRRGLRSKEPVIFAAAGDGLITYLGGGEGLDRYLVKRLAAGNEPVRQSAIALLLRLAQ